MILLSRVWCLRAITIREFTLEELLAAKNAKSIAHNHSKGVYLFFIYIQNPKTVNPLCQRSFNASFKCASALSFHPHPCRAQRLFIFCVIIHLAFISTTISRPGKGNRLLPLKREGRRGAYADRDDDVTAGHLSHFT